MPAPRDRGGRKETPRFAVVCPCYVRTAKSREHAERLVEAIAKIGACGHEHVIVDRESEEPETR